MCQPFLFKMLNVSFIGYLQKKLMIGYLQKKSGTRE